MNACGFVSLNPLNQHQGHMARGATLKGHYAETAEEDHFWNPPALLVTAQQSQAEAAAPGSLFFRHCGTESVWFHPLLTGTSTAALGPPNVPPEDVRRTFWSRPTCPFDDMNSQWISIREKHTKVELLNNYICTYTFPCVFTDSCQFVLGMQSFISCFVASAPSACSVISWIFLYLCLAGRKPGGSSTNKPSITTFLNVCHCFYFSSVYSSSSFDSENKLYPQGSKRLLFEFCTSAIIT